MSIQIADDANEMLPPFRGMSFFQKVFKRAYTPAVESRGLGYGLFPCPKDAAPLRRSAVSHMLSLLDDGRVPAKTADNLMAMAVVREMMTDVFREASFDWFTTSYNLGQPSGRLALQASRSLSALREHVISGDAVLALQAMDELSRWAVPEMLDSYLLLDENPDTDEIEEAVGWAYMLWSPDLPGVAAIGVTEGTVMEEIENLGEDYPDVSPFGVLSAWQVADPAHAAEIVENELMFAYTGKDVFHDLGPRPEGNFEVLSLKERVETALVRAGQLVLSPWHIEEQLEAAAVQETAQEAAPAPIF